MKNAGEAMESDIGSPDLSGLAEASLFADSGFDDTIVGSTFGSNDLFPNSSNGFGGPNSESSLLVAALGGVGNAEKVITSFGNSLANNAGVIRIGDNFRIYGPTANGGVFRGNQHVRTHSLSNIGRGISRVSGPVGHGISVLEVGTAFADEDLTFGPRTQVTAGRAIGGTGGAAAGAYLGALAGTPFGGIGAIPGGVIGGFIGGVFGGFGGSYVGGEAVEYLQGN